MRTRWSDLERALSLRAPVRLSAPVASKAAVALAAPEAVRKPAPTVALPTRQTVRKQAPAPVEVPVAAVVAAEDEPALATAEAVEEGRTWEERLGPVGVILCALLACALAWFLTMYMF